MTKEASYWALDVSECVVEHGVLGDVVEGSRNCGECEDDRCDDVEPMPNVADLAECLALHLPIHQSPAQDLLIFQLTLKMLIQVFRIGIQMQE